MSSLYTRQLPVAIVAFTGTLILLDFFVTNPLIDQAEFTITSWAAMIIMFSTYLGMSNTLIQQGRNVSRRSEGWIYSLYTLVFYFVYVALGFLPTTGFWSMKHPIFLWVFDHIHFPCENTIFNLLCLYVIGAAARVFRARSIESIAMFATVILVSFNIAPVYAVINSTLPQLGSWMMDVPNVGGYRGVYITLGIGAIALGIRQIVGREKSVLGIAEVTGA